MRPAKKANRHVEGILDARLEYHKNHPKLANHPAKESIEALANIRPGVIEAYLHAACMKEIAKIKKMILPHLAVYALQEERQRETLAKADGRAEG